MDHPGPYQIEYAHLLTASTVNEQLKVIRQPNQRKKENALALLEQHKDILIVEYHNTEQSALLEYKNRHSELALLKKAFDEKACHHCHKKLQFHRNMYMDYYSCPEYKDNNPHSKFYADYGERHQARLPWIKMRVESDWVTNILKTTGLKSQLLATDLFAFYHEYGYVDLRLKYGLSGTHQLISNIGRTKHASTQEEKEIADFLRPLFDKTVEQQGVRYKLGDERETLAVLDLVVSNDNTVYLLEIKRHPYVISQDQLNLYHALLQHILHKASDQRRIQPLFIVYHTPQYPVPYLAGIYVLYDEIKILRSAADIIPKFENMTERTSYEYRLIDPLDYHR